MGTIENAKIHREKAVVLIQRRVKYMMGLGVIPVPVLDTTSILGTLTLMVHDLAKEYTLPFVEEKVKFSLGALLGKLAAMPNNTNFSDDMASATTAIGEVFVQHFENGGTIEDFQAIQFSEAFEAAFKIGQVQVAQLRKKSTNQSFNKIKYFSLNKSINKKVENNKNKLPMKTRLLDALEARKKRQRRNLNRLAAIVSIGILLGIGFWVIHKTKVREGPTPVVTDIDFLIQESTPIAIDLMYNKNLSPAALSKLAAFPENSTEGVIWDYLSREGGNAYPKRFALSAIRFINNSAELSSGGKEQLDRIAFLMRLFPEIEIHLYGHTFNTGASIERQRIGRERARVLKSIFIKEGIPSFRLTGNYIEKESGVHTEYWGAEIVLDVSTAETDVMVRTPTLESDDIYID